MGNVDIAVTAPVEDPDRDAFHLGSVLQACFAGEGDGGGKEFGPYGDIVPDPVSAQGEPCEIDALFVGYFDLLQKVIEEREEGFEEIVREALAKE